MKKRICILTTILLVILQLLPMVPTINFVNVNANAVDNNIADVELDPIISAPIVNFTESITVTYEEINDIDFEVEYEIDGINVVLVEGSECLELEIYALRNIEFGTLTINATSSNGLIYSNILYTYNSGNKFYLSEFSKDHALYLGLQDMYNSNILSEVECENKYAEFTSHDIIKTDFIDWIVEGTVTTVSGRIKWEVSNTPDLEEDDNPTLPMRNTLVQVGVKIDEIFIPWASDYTDAEGNYNIEIDHSGVLDGADLYIRVKLEAHTILLATDWFFDHYFYEEKVIEHNLEAGTVIQAKEHILRYDSNSWLYKATYVHQAMVIGERFAEEMGMNTSRIVRVAFPGGRLGEIDEALIDQGFCGGNIFNSSYSTIGINAYNNIDMIIHEYSHYVQMSMEIYGATFEEICKYNPEHNSAHDEYLKKGNKKFAMHLAWSEAWGYVFSAMAQKYYKYQYNNMENYNSNLSINRYLSTGDYKGEFQEKSVACFLWSLFDEAKPKNKYNFVYPLTYKEWWDMTTVSGTCRLPDFINLIENESYNLGVDIDYEQIKEFVAEKLTTYNIAPKINSVGISEDNNGLLIEFQPNGSSSYPNNRFIVKIYNENNEKIYESEEDICDVSNTSNYFYLIDITDWNDIVSSVYCGQTIYISVEGYRYDENADDNVKKSGPYYSQYFAFTINGDHNYSCEMVDSNTHTRTCETCSFETTIEHDYNYSKYSSATHYAECSSCNYRGEKNHRYQEIDVNDTSHNLKCQDCGYINKFNHRFTYTPFGSTHHYAKCQDCSYIDYREHSMQYTTEDGIHYRNYCQVCGYSNGEELHTWVYTSINSLYHEVHCADCGEIKVSQESHSWKVASNPQYVECQYCGHLKLKPTGGGGIIPVQPFKEDEIEEETE